MAPKPACSIADCNRPARSRGWCGAHYERWRKHGDPLGSTPRPTREPCVVDGCDRLHFARGWCHRHYTRWTKHGDPNAYMRNRRTCSVENCDQPAEAFGWCGMHAARWRKYGDPVAPVRPWRVYPTTCTVDGCSRRSRARGFCGSHYTAYVGRPKRRGASTDTSHTAEEWRARLAEYGGECVYCGGTADTRDHVIPLSRGGTNSIDNIVPACRSCNARKGNRDDWREWGIDAGRMATGGVPRPWQERELQQRPVEHDAGGRALHGRE